MREAEKHWRKGADGLRDGNSIEKSESELVEAIYFRFALYQEHTLYKQGVFS